MLTRESILAGPARDSVAVKVAGQDAFLRHPTFAEWRGIVARHGETKPVAAEAAAKAVATLLVDAEGNRMFPDTEIALLLQADPSIVAGLYAKAWETVLKVDDDRVEEAKGE
jgi:hypothetical protein